MRKWLTALLAGAALTTGLIAIQPATAAAPTQTTVTQTAATKQTILVTGDGAGRITSVKIDGQQVPLQQASYAIYNFYRFAGTYICQNDNIGGGYYWPTIGVGNYFEYGASPIVLANDNGETAAHCTSYPFHQRINYGLFSAPPSGGCYFWSGTSILQNGYRYWAEDDNINAQLNSQCDVYGAQFRANLLSRVTGQMMGLNTYSVSTETGCVMNYYWAYSYDYAASCDTNRLNGIY